MFPSTCLLTVASPGDWTSFLSLELSIPQRGMRVEVTILNSLFRGACLDTSLVISEGGGSGLVAKRISYDLVSLGMLDLQTRLLVTQHLILRVACSGHSISAR